MSTQHRVAILGGGSFGTALANIVADNGHEVCLWLRNAERAAEINHEHRNRHYLPELLLNPAVRASISLTETLAGRNIVFMAVPSHACRQVAQAMAPLLMPGCLLISTTKGIEPSGFRLMSEVLREEAPNARLGVLSGPNLAREIAAREITATVIASPDAELNRTIQDLLHCSYFRVYASSDSFGVELAGALKNIYAIVAGMAAAMNIGHNTVAVLITRSLAEMSRFAVQKGADPSTFLGLAGVGDLLVTCMSPLSRNYRVGYQLGQGKPLAAVVADLGQVAEGVNTLRLVRDEAQRLQVRMPLVQGLYEIIYNGAQVNDVVGNLMGAEQPRDVEFTLRSASRDAALDCAPRRG